MKSLNYVFHRRIKDTSTRRAEIWKLFDSDEYKILVWIELQDPSVELSWQEAADILRLMNDENLTRLFLFTNGNLDEDARDILEDENHFIYTPRYIIEKILSIREMEEKAEELEEKKKEVEERPEEKPAETYEEIPEIEEVEPELKVRKRQKFDKPCGHAIIVEYFKTKEEPRKKTKITFEELKTIVSYIIDNYKETQNLIDSLDIDNITKEQEELLDKYVKKFLPALYKISLIAVDKEFRFVLEELARLLKNIIYYISAITEYEVVENIDIYKKEIEDALNKLSSFDEKIYEYMQTNVSAIRRNFNSLIKYIFVILLFVLIFVIFFI
jgi:hypothetical protein